MDDARVEPAHGVEVVALAPALGAEVHCGDIRNLNAEAFGELHRAWLQHLVIVVRDQALDDVELARFARRFGPLKRASVAAWHGDNPDPACQVPAASDPARELEVHTVSNVTDENGSSLGILGAGTVHWHSDMASFQEPPSASILYALEVPARGGDTYFCNMYVAYDTLPKKLKRELLSYAIHHRVVPGSSSSGTGARHPLVCTHPDTGHNALFLGARQHTAISGLPKHESDRLLDFLWARATLPEFGYRHRWRPGDVLIWDNRCTIHYRDPFDPRDRRVLLRVQVEGSATPRLAPNALELSPHPRGSFSEE